MGEKMSQLRCIGKTLSRKAIFISLPLALGTKQGSTIENEDGTLLKDNKKQNLVVSRINPMLETLTAKVDGTYLVSSGTTEATAEALQSAMDAQKQQIQEITKMQYHYTELYQIPLFIALILFLMLHTRASKYLLILFTLSGLPASSLCVGRVLSTSSLRCVRNCKTLILQKKHSRK